MTWVLVGGGAAVVLVLAMVLWAIWLLHRAQDLWWQIRQLGARLTQVVELAEQLRVSPTEGNLETVRRRTQDARRTAR